MRRRRDPRRGIQRRYRRAELSRPRARGGAPSVTGCEIEIAEGSAADSRSYRVDFSKLARAFPDLALEWNAERGARELVDAYRQVGLTSEDFDGNRYIRLRRLLTLLDEASSTTIFAGARLSLRKAVDEDPVFAVEFEPGLTTPRPAVHSSRGTSSFPSATVRRVRARSRPRVHGGPCARRGGDGGAGRS